MIVDNSEIKFIMFEVKRKIDRYKKLCNDIDYQSVKFHRLGYEEYYAIWKNQIVGVTPKCVGFYPLCMITNWNEYKLNFDHIGDLVHETAFRQVKDLMRSDIGISPSNLFKKLHGSGPREYRGGNKPLPDHLDTFYAVKKRFIGEINIATKKRKMELILQN